MVSGIKSKPNTVGRIKPKLNKTKVGTIKFKPNKIKISGIKLKSNKVGGISPNPTK